MAENIESKKIMSENKRSQAITQGVQRSPNRAMLRAVGFGDDDFAKPIVGLANGYSTIARMNIPSIFVYGGTIKPGHHDGKDLTVVSSFEAVGNQTDGRFSGGTYGMVVGHVAPEAYVGGTIALVHEGDSITIDVPQRLLQLNVSDAELATRRTNWQAPAPRYTTGILGKYAKLVSSSSLGAVTDMDLF
jgi:dihydroxyacid dehydratase/phosphogluconate dehydratase